MTHQLGREASQFLQRAMREERDPTSTELARVRHSLLQAAAVITATTAAAPLAAQTIAGKASALAIIGKGSFFSAVVVGMSVGAVALGGGSWLMQRAEVDAPTEAPRVSTTVKARSVLPNPTAASTAVQPAALPMATIRPVFTENPVAKMQPPRAPAARAVAEREQPPIEASPTRKPSSPALATAAVARFEPEGHASISAELFQLEAAQRALNGGNAAQTLSILTRLDSTALSKGMLDERLALEALAACQLGQTARAERAANRLLQRSPGSPLLARLRTSCAFNKNR